MSSSRRSLITWSPGFAFGDYDTNLVIAGLGLLEIGACQLNDWLLHELPDFLPFCQSGVPFNTPILSLAATSSLPTTWAEHKPPSLKRRLCPAKRLRGHITVDLRGAGTEFQTFVPSAFLTLHQTPFPSLDTWLHQRLSSIHICASRNVRKNPFVSTVSSLFCILTRSKFFSANPRRSSTLSISNSLQRSSDHQKVPLLLLLLMFAAF